MRILINELKKIFNIKSILVVLLINVAIYSLFIKSSMDVFPNGRPQLDEYRLAVKMINEKGNNLEDKDIKYLYNMKKDRLMEVNNYLKNNKKAKQLNIKDYNSFDKKNDGSNEAVQSLNDDIFFKDNVNVFWELQVIDRYIEIFKNKNNHDELLTPKYKNRINEIKKNKSQNSILPALVFENYENIIKETSVAVLISIIFMIAPIFTRDKRVSLESLQYTSKRGRRLYKDKIKAALIATPIIITIQLGMLFFLYSTRPYTVSIFYNSNINSFLDSLFWFDVTFIQYIILTVIVLYILGEIVTLITCYISRCISNYILLIGVLVPISAILIYITKSKVLHSFIGLFQPKYKELIIIIILTIIGVTLVSIKHKKEKTIDIVL
ncbi:hypothetical protein [Hathewaya limosa]|uniref:ABC transporter permease n=1 Tax=Hathewaya limosa TaxID=1536 RepID=A0ABU0JT13_HATLI|nr:hypothetical protein [Hathewaya limosa]MDQ0480194.1 hypothetical protein [Hathewaya limosa]